METNLHSWLHHRLSHGQSSYLNSSSHLLNLGTVNNIPHLMNPCAKVASPNRTLTEIVSSGIPYPNQCQPNESHVSLHGIPHCHQALNDVANILCPEKTPYLPHNKEVNTSNPGSGLAKKFLVFDQSGDQTTLFFSPGINSPVRLPSGGPKLHCDYHVNKMVQTDIFQHQEPILTCEFHEKLGDDVESDMREDTEEINALLYSDDEYYYEDEEETSTGHSPSTMTEFEKYKWGEDNEQVDSNFGPNKRIKLSKGGFEVSPQGYSEYEDDAESSCGDEQNQDFGGKKRTREDIIREKVSLIQSIIPGGKGKGKNAILILDEAIDYLKSLKAKAQALGVSTI